MKKHVVELVRLPGCVGCSKDCLWNCGATAGEKKPSKKQSDAKSFACKYNCNSSK